jgi:hypothetical protein
LRRALSCLLKAFNAFFFLNAFGGVCVSRKVYEGEWVDGIPKCGQLRDAPSGSFDDGQFAAAAAASSFAIPPLRMIGPDSVVAEAMAHVRHSRPPQVILNEDSPPARTTTRNTSTELFSLRALTRHTPRLDHRPRHH